MSIILVTGLLIGTLFFSISNIQDQTEQKIQESLISNSLDKQQETAKRVSLHISSDLELISHKIAHAATILGNDNFKSKYTLDTLEKLHSNLNSKTDVGWVFILDEHGMVTSSANSTGASISTSQTDLSFRDYFIYTKTTLGYFFTNGLMGVNDVPLIITTYPILDTNGKFMGLIAASLDINEFFKQYGNIDDPDSELLVIIGNDKNFITHPNPQFFEKNVFSEEFSVQLDSKGLDIIETLFTENSSYGQYRFANQQKIASAQAVMIDGKPLYYVFMTTSVDGIYQQTNLILEQEKFSTVLIILFLTFGSGVTIFVFEKYKMIEQKQKDAKLITIGELSARLAHDLRNPLSIIQISLENLKSLYGTDDTKQRQFDKVERSIDRMVHQLDNVLDFVKEQPLILDKTKMSEVISESLDSLVIPDTIKLILPENDIELFCDKKQLAVALNNLILNGIQAIEGEGTVEIRIKDNLNFIIFEIEDSGTGISEQNISQIFEPLFTTKLIGTGLGLASVKSIIEAHGGTISVTCSPTIFRIELPKSQ